MNSRPPKRGFGPERLARLARAERWHFWFVGRQALVRRSLGRHLGGAGRLILDVGCGTGFMTETLAEAGHRGVGIDLRPEGLRAGEGRPPGCRYLRADATRLPFREGRFDGVLLLDVLEHVDDRLLLAEVRRVLRPGGVAVVTAPAMPWLWSRRDEAAGHLRRYTRRRLVASIREAGLGVEEIGYYQFFLFPLVVATRFLGRGSRTVQDAEERPSPFLNDVMRRINAWEVRLAEFIPWPWGSSLAAVCRKP